MNQQQRIEDWMTKYDGQLLDYHRREAAVRLVTLLIKEQDRLDGLARSVLATLQLQEEYFKSRSPQALRACRNRERLLRQEAFLVLNPASPGLFDEKIKEGP